MNSPANELAERMEYEELWDAELRNAVVEFSGMDFERAMAVFRDQRDERQWDLMLERSE